MAVLVLLIVAGVAYSAVLAVLTSRTYFQVSSNRPFAPAWPEIDPPLWRVALGHIASLLSTVLWLLRWPSVIEVWMALCLVPLLFVPFPLILNNVLEWGTYLIYGNAQGGGSHRDVSSGAPPLRWPSTTLLGDLMHAALSAYNSVTSWLWLMWQGQTWNANTVNYNHSLLCYLQNESWGKMHHLDSDVLNNFPTAGPNSRANAVMMARCATMSYDRWHNIDQAISLRWNEPTTQQPSTSTRQQKYSLVKAWSFDRVTVPSSLKPQDPNTSSQENSWQLNGSDISWTTLLQLLVSLQKKVTAVKLHLKDTILKALRRIVWYWAGAGTPDPAKPLFDADKFTSINTDAFLMRADGEVNKKGGKDVALVLAFRGTEALQTVDWISDLAQVAPPPQALDPGFFPLGFTHQGFRDSLGLKSNLRPANDLEGFSSSYLVYEPSSKSSRDVSSTTGSAAASAASPVWTQGSLRRVTPSKDDPQEGPFMVITRAIDKAITDIRKEGTNITVKLFVTGHSLGGALAHLYTGALLLQPAPKSPSAKNFEGVYTFGEPRVGGQTWVTLVEEALRNVKGPGGVSAEDRFKRVVNTLDIVTRIPPPLGEIYQHPGHCTFVKPHFAIARPAQMEGARLPAAPASAAVVHASDSSYSPVANLIETPEVFLGPTVLTVLLKLVLSLLLLLSAVVTQVVDRYGWEWPAATLSAIAVVFWPVTIAALAGITTALALAVFAVIIAASLSIFVFVFWPSLYAAIIGPVLKELQVSFLMVWKSLKQPVGDRPRLLNNPTYLITRLVALLGPAPIVLLLDLLLLPTVVVLAPFVGWVLLIEPVLVGLLFLLMPPVIIGGLIDHSMAEYYTACWLTTDADWTTITSQL